MVKDGAILAEKGYGYSDGAARKPVDPERTLFRPGSIAKLFTWTAVMQQVEAGKLDLDKDVNDYLDFKIPPSDGKPITLRNIMTHTPGFDDTAKNLMFNDPARLVSLRDYLVHAMPKRIFPPGVTPAYSNYATALAGYIVQRVSGQPYDEYIEQHIFAPLGMKDSTFRQPLPERFQPLMSKSYQPGAGEPSKYELVGPAPAGSLASTGADMGRFMIAHLQNGEYQGKRILQPATVEMMHNTPLTLLPPLNRMELGFFETNVNEHEVIGHLGDTQDFHSSLHLFLKEGVGLYASFNSTGTKGAVGKLRTALFTDFADRYFPGKPTNSRVDPKIAAEHARMMAGTWTVSRGSQSHFLDVIELLGQMHIGVDDGKLSVPLLTGLNSQPRKWVEVTPFVWHDLDSHERIAAKVVNGKAVRMSFDLVAPFMVFDRTPWYKNSAWLKPLFFTSLGLLALTVLLWPIRAIVRRRYGSSLALDEHGLSAFRWSRIGALAIIAALALWIVIIALITTNLDNATSRLDPLIWFAEIAGTICFIGGFALTFWNLWVVWTGERSWQAKFWSVVLVLSAFFVLWVAFAFKLISFGVQY